MNCQLCNSKSYTQREGSVRDNKDLSILECDECGLVYLSSMDHIDEGFYEESNMHDMKDIDEWLKETYPDDKRRFAFLEESLQNKTILDFGSGAGGFLNLAKKTAKKLEGLELEKRVEPTYTKNGIGFLSDIDLLEENKYDVITAFHVIEHIKEPLDVLEKLKKALKPTGKIIIEVPNANDALLTVYNSEAFSHFTYWSCHLYLYNHSTFQLLAKKAQLKVDFIKHIQRYPLSNHLYWLSNDKPGGHHKWGNFIDSQQLNKAYEDSLSSISATDTILAQLCKN